MREALIARLTHGGGAKILNGEYVGDGGWESSPAAVAERTEVVSEASASAAAVLAMTKLPSEVFPPAGAELFPAAEGVVPMAMRGAAVLPSAMALMSMPRLPSNVFPPAVAGVVPMALPGAAKLP